MPKIELYASVACPFARRAMIAAHEKQIDFSLFPVPLTGQIKKLQAGGDRDAIVSAYWEDKSVEEIVQVREDFKKNVNPKGEVPTVVYRHDSSRRDIITEADVASEFLDDAFPDSGTSLMPRTDAVARSKIRHAVKILNSNDGVHRASYGLLMNQDPAKDEALRASLYKGLAELAGIASSEGPFFLGEAFSLTDVLLAPMWDQFRFILPHYRGVELFPQADSEPWAARMHQWAAAVEQRESFKKNRMDKEKYIRGYKGYAGSRGESSFGQ